MRVLGEVLAFVTLIALCQFVGCGVRTGDGKHYGGDIFGCAPMDWGVK